MSQPSFTFHVGDRVDTPRGRGVVKKVQPLTNISILFVETEDGTTVSVDSRQAQPSSG